MDGLKAAIKKFLLKKGNEDDVCIKNVQKKEEWDDRILYEVKFESRGKEVSNDLIVFENNSEQHVKTCSLQNLLAAIESSLKSVSDENSTIFVNIFVVDDYFIKEVPSFERFEQFKQLSFGQNMEIVKTLASFHAASTLHLGDRDRETIKLPSSDEIEKIQTFLSNFLQHKNKNSWEEKLNNILADLRKEWSHSELKTIEVLNHGDISPEHLWLRRRGCGIFDVQIDFSGQTHVNSPIWDLVHFFVTCCGIPSLEEIDILLQIYHRQLDQMCHLLNSPLNFSLQDLKKEFFEKQTFYFFIFFKYLGPHGGDFDEFKFLQGFEFFSYKFEG